MSTSRDPLFASPLLERTVALLYWPMLLGALYVLLRGHNAPGGGFIGALLAVAASAAVALVFGPATARRRLPADPLALSALGLGLGALAGLPAFWLGEAFLTHQWGALPLGFTELALSTVLIFDLGVFLCVWGALAGFSLKLLEARQ